MATDAGRQTSLRVIFMGTPDVALPVLSALMGGGCDVIGVYTQPDRRSGRGRRVSASPVKQAALEHGLPLYQPASLRRDDEARRHIASVEPDMIMLWQLMGCSCRLRYWRRRGLAR